MSVLVKFFLFAALVLPKPWAANAADGPAIDFPVIDIPPSSIIYAPDFTIQGSNVIEFIPEGRVFVLGFNMGTSAEVTLQISPDLTEKDFIVIKKPFNIDRIIEITQGTETLKVIVSDYFNEVETNEKVLKRRFKEAYRDIAQLLLREINWSTAGYVKIIFQALVAAVIASIVSIKLTFAGLSVVNVIETTLLYKIGLNLITLVVAGFGFYKFRFEKMKKIYLDFIEEITHHRMLGNTQIAIQWGIHFKINRRSFKCMKFL